jgi:hypothetical protein
MDMVTVWMEVVDVIRVGLVPHAPLVIFLHFFHQLNENIEHWTLNIEHKHEHHSHYSSYDVYVYVCVILEMFSRRRVAFECGKDRKCCYQQMAILSHCASWSYTTTHHSHEPNIPNRRLWSLYSTWSSPWLFQLVSLSSFLSFNILSFMFL